MVGSNGTMIAIRLVRSKLRKREEHSNSVHPVGDAVVLQTTTPGPFSNAAAINGSVCQDHQDPLAYRGQILWAFPPTPQSQCMYNNDQNLVQSLPAERHGFVRGFRKNLGGKWRRLVKRKPPTTEVYTIPAELKPQLKQIYVY